MPDWGSLALDAAYFAMWTFMLLVVLGLGATALWLAFMAGAQWKNPDAEDPQNWKWLLGLAIALGGWLLISQRY